ncbi:hypothetical protein E2C01_074294 [Portunus trituberculatus]|uniref:Uncharacterized protein n=1 Tax=Portunus trituberculatus TaxID=210409 RepID=A0A5B7I5B4_PORTR|nr:hypothetical protein [Portunus trituberculatus]
MKGTSLRCSDVGCDSCTCSPRCITHVQKHRLWPNPYDHQDAEIVRLSALPTPSGSLRNALFSHHVLFPKAIEMMSRVFKSVSPVNNVEILSLCL